MIYLATPYTDPDPAVMEARFDLACRIAGYLMARGHVVFSPIAHSHPIAVRCELPRGWEFWEQQDAWMIDSASELVVAKMRGWERSKGITKEIEIAHGCGVPVRYMEVPDGM
jgi:hypothetical protein